MLISSFNVFFFKQKQVPAICWTFKMISSHTTREIIFNPTDEESKAQKVYEALPRAINQI